VKYVVSFLLVSASGGFCVGRSLVVRLAWMALMMAWLWWAMREAENDSWKRMP